MLKEIFEISGLEELRIYLAGIVDQRALRERLYSAFLKYSEYGTVSEWNALVRICEALAIIGWGEHEPLEAVRGSWFNGNPETFLLNRYSKPRYLDAVWSKRGGGYAIDYGLSSLHGSREAPLPEPVRLQRGSFGEEQNLPLSGQRNWIPKNPIRIVRGLANCYDSSRALVESIDKELMPSLHERMCPEIYGDAVDAITINISLSFYDNYHCKTNYIIADESLKLKRKDFYPHLLTMFSEKEIEDNGYYLRNRFTYGPSRKETGKARVDIVLEREFSQLPVAVQKQVLGGYLIHAVGEVARRLERKTDYNFPQMISDFRAVLDSWCNDAVKNPNQ